MKEIDVVRKTRRFLDAHGLLQRNVLDLYTDAHPDLLVDSQLQPFQRFNLQFDAFSVHPDLVGRLDDGGTMFAIEAKGDKDWLKGIAQADTYRQGFHCALLSYSGVPSADMLALARQRGVGVISVKDDNIAVIEPPQLSLPQLHLAESIRKQFNAANSLEKQFYYNLPTHYLACISCLSVWGSVFGVSAALTKELEVFVRSLYPDMPKEFRPALSGAEKLGAVKVGGNVVELTRLGRACGELLPPPQELSFIHKATKKKPLVDVAPMTAAVLRMLLEGDLIARFIAEVLAGVGPYNPLPMPALVETASRVNKDLAPVVFFFPRSLDDLIDDQGFIIWRRVQAKHYRTTIYYQYKQILTHAGVIKNYQLAGSSFANYQPDKDLWELAV